MQQNESPLIRALTEYYDGRKILSTNFACAHLVQCQGCRASAPQQFTIPPEETLKRSRERITGKFVQAKAASVGAHYENALTLGVRIPRLMFVSADPGSSVYSNGRNWVPPENRTPEFIRRIRSRSELKPTGSAGIWQHKIASCIYEEFGAVDLPENTAPYFVNVNAAKCCENKPKNELASLVLFENCRKYLRGEIDILLPDVIVSQGREAMASIGRAFSISAVSGRGEVVDLGANGRAFWLPTHHPNSGKHFHKQRNGKEWGPDWKGLAKRVREFLSAQDSRFTSPAF